MNFHVSEDASGGRLLLRGGRGRLGGGQLPRGCGPADRGCTVWKKNTVHLIIVIFYWPRNGYTTHIYAVFIKICLVKLEKTLFGERILINRQK